MLPMPSKAKGPAHSIEVKDKLKKKIAAEFRPYRILGACNPQLAHEALQANDKFGAMLSCNVIVQQFDHGTVEVVAIDPVTSMQAVDDDDLGRTASEARRQLSNVIESL